MSSPKKSTEEQIADLTLQLCNITEQLKKLQIELVKEKKTSSQFSRRKLQIGDQAIVTNNYQNLKGTVGTVIKLTTNFGTIRTTSGKEITRNIKNLQIISNSDL